MALQNMLNSITKFLQYEGYNAFVKDYTFLLEHVEPVAIASEKLDFCSVMEFSTPWTYTVDLSNKFYFVRRDVVLDTYMETKENVRLNEADFYRVMIPYIVYRWEDTPDEVLTTIYNLLRLNALDVKEYPGTTLKTVHKSVLMCAYNEVVVMEAVEWNSFS